MNMKTWLKTLTETPQKKALPILSFPCVQLLGISVNDLVKSGALQAEGMMRIADRCDTAAAVSMMDLSVEAEAFGAEIRFSEDEVPTVIGALITSAAEANSLQIPPITAGRCSQYIEAVRLVSGKINDRPVLAGVIGPYSLAGRLMDVSEIMVSCYTDPETVHTVLEKVTRFLISYIRAYKEVGAGGVIMAEPLTGMLSPDLAREFSSPYVRQIVDAVQDDDFLVIYHNCGNNTPLMSEEILAVGAAAYHFGNVVKMSEMLALFPREAVLMGNVDPAGQFKNGTPESIREATLRLSDECAAYPNFILSSGCDIPADSSWENIDAFFAAAAGR